MEYRVDIRHGDFREVLAYEFPLIEGEEFAALVDDIREHGSRNPCWRTRGVDRHPA